MKYFEKAESRWIIPNPVQFKGLFDEEPRV